MMAQDKVVDFGDTGKIEIWEDGRMVIDIYAHFDRVYFPRADAERLRDALTEMLATQETTP